MRYGVLAAALFILMTQNLEAKLLDKEEIKQDIADGKQERGWRALRELLLEANKNEKDPATLKKNERVVQELIGTSSNSRTSTITNFDSSQKNSLNGKDDVKVFPPGEALPKIEKQLIDTHQKGRKKVLEVSFNASYGKVVYEMTFPRKHLFKRTNVFYLEIASTISRLRFVLDCGKGNEFVFDYQGLTPNWQAVILPFESFQGFDPEMSKTIQALRIEVDGEEWAEDQLEGVFMLDNLKLMTLAEKDLLKQKEETGRHRQESPAAFVENLYKERAAF